MQRSLNPFWVASIIDLKSYSLAWENSWHKIYLQMIPNNIKQFDTGNIKGIGASRR